MILNGLLMHSFARQRRVTAQQACIIVCSLQDSCLDRCTHNERKEEAEQTHGLWSVGSVDAFGINGNTLYLIIYIREREAIMASRRVFNSRETAWNLPPPLETSNATSSPLDGRSTYRTAGTSAKRDLYPALPSAAQFYVPSLPGIGNLASHPT